MYSPKDQQSAAGFQKQVQTFEINCLQDKSIDKDLNEISQIEKFLQRNYRDVNNLQSYLIKELQTIENCKSRNKKVHKLIVSNIIPTFSEIKNQIRSLKSIIPLLNSLATTYIETIYEKSAGLLNQKQAKCRRYETQIQDLKRKLSQLNDKQQQSAVPAPEKIIQSKSQMQNQKLSYFNKATQRVQTQDFTNALQPSFSKADKLSVICPKNSIESQEISVVSFNQEVSKTRKEDKLNKYEEVYQNILKSKKVNISYKCEKSPIKTEHETRSPSKSPYHAKATTTHRQQQTLQDRKHYIKQKIEKIKLKAECKQYQRNVTQKQRFR